MTTIASMFPDAGRYRSAASALSTRPTPFAVPDPVANQKRAPGDNPPAKSAKAAAAPSPDAKDNLYRQPIPLALLDLLSVHTLANAVPINVAELPEADYQEFTLSDKRSIASQRSMLEQRYTDNSWLDSLPTSPVSLPYATVVSRGRVIATIDNQGCAITDTERADRLKGRISNGSDGKTGPELAKVVAKEVAALLDGVVKVAPTALTQSEFVSAPRYGPPPPDIDVEALQKDPEYQQMQRMVENLERIQRERIVYLAKQKAGVA